jgi:penicillin-binding protein-related factor A (putative recombinase)
VKEKQIENAILNWLALQSWFFFKINNTGIHGTEKSGRKFWRSKSKYDINGKSDIMGVIDGRFIAIEVKTPDRILKVSDAQHEFLYNTNMHGGLGFVASSIDDVKEVFKQEGIL